MQKNKGIISFAISETLTNVIISAETAPETLLATVLYPKTNINEAGVAPSIPA